LREVKAKWTVKRLRKGADQEGLRLLRRATNGDISDVTRRGFTSSEKRSLQSFVDGTSEIFRKILEVEAEECPHNINPMSYKTAGSGGSGGSGGGNGSGSTSAPRAETHGRPSDQSDEPDPEPAEPEVVDPSEGPCDDQSYQTLESITVCGEEILAVRAKDGTPGVVVRRVCEILGVDFSSQTIKLKSTPWATVVMIPTVDKRGSKRELFCLHARAVPQWLVTIHASKVKPELRDRLIRFQCEARDALADWAYGRSQAQASEAIVLAPQQLIQLVEQLAGPVAQIAADRLSESFFARTLQLAESLKGSDETLAGLLAISVESHMRAEEFMAKAAQEMRGGVETIQRAAQSCEGIYGMLDSLKGEIDSLASNKRHLIDSLGRQITRLENI
jgi:hypothetical protein